MKLTKQLIILMCCTLHGFKKSYLNKIILDNETYQTADYAYVLYFTWFQKSYLNKIISNVYICAVFYMVFKSYLNKTISTICS